MHLEKVTTRKEENKIQRQRKITEFIQNKYREDTRSGNIITTQKEFGQLRCIVQNTNGIMNYGDVQESKLALYQLKHLQVDIIVLVETNKNWHHSTVRRKWEKLVKSTWKHSTMVMTNTPNTYGYGEYQPGGVCIIVTNRYANRVVEKRRIQWVDGLRLRSRVKEVIH